MKCLTHLLICALAIGLSSCSYISKSSFSQNKDKSYLSAKSIAPLKIPPGIANSSFSETYPVPNRNYAVSAEDVSIAPPGLDQA